MQNNNFINSHFIFCGIPKPQITVAPGEPEPFEMKCTPIEPEPEPDNKPEPHQQPEQFNLFREQLELKF